jgi:hypothetical protein
MPNSVTPFFGHLYFSGLWFGAAPRTRTKRMFVKEIRLHVENMLIILDSYSQFN